MYRLFKTLFWGVALALLVAGCTPQPVRGPATVDSGARAAMERGDYARAAREYLMLADSAQQPDALRQQYRLEAADALLHDNQVEHALQLLEALDPNRFSPQEQLRLRMLTGQAWLAQRNADKTLEQLEFTPPPDTPAATLAEFHHLRALAYAHLGNNLEAAREFMLRGRYLTDDAARTDNQQQLWNSLSQLSAQTLHAMRMAPPPDEFSGWLALAEISKQYQLGRGEMQALIAQWRQDYPQHPASDSLVEGIVQRNAQLVLQPKQIALLLPLSGRFAAAGAAVRDGIAAAYYKVDPQRRIRLRVYDVANPATVHSHYQQAIADGADFVIGPLSKEGVAALMEEDKFPVPTLVLNTVDTTPLPDNLYQFSLAPEEEAQQVAEHAWLLGYTHAAALVPEGEWGERIEQAFDQRWQQLGGTTTTQASYDSSKNDFSRPLRALLNLDLSYGRERQLESVLGENLQFEPRRRQDIDFVFLAGFPRQARLIRPQLKFHHASDLPVLATSHVYSGAFAPELDRDMDGIVFGDMPWTLKADSPNKALRAETADLHLADNSLQRLVAMGIDTYDLIPVLQVLKAYPFERFQGETGSLRLDDDRRVRRQLTWARFNLGIPRLVDPTNPR